MKKGKREMKGRQEVAIKQKIWKIEDTTHMESQKTEGNLKVRCARKESKEIGRHFGKRLQDIIWIST